MTPSRCTETLQRAALPGAFVAALLAAVCGAGCGGPSDPSSDPAGAPGDAPPSGFWFPAGAVGEAGPGPDALGSLGYAPGYERARDDADGEWSGVRIHDEGAADPGPFVFASGHEPAAFVLHPDGEIERRWSLDGHPDNAELQPEFRHATQRAWRRVEPLPDGGLLAIHEGLCLLRLDASSRIVWRGVPGAHHDLARIGPDTIVVLDRTPRRSSTAAAAHRGAADRADWIVDDGLAWVDLATGAVRQRVSLLDLVARSDAASLLDQALERAGSLDLGDGRRTLDPLHANAVLELPQGAEASPEERKASVRLVVLLRDVGALLTLRADRADPEATATVEGLDLGAWQGAHDPQLAAPTVGRSPGAGARVVPLVLFDNHGDRARTTPASRLVRVELGPTGASPLEVLFEGSPAFPFHSAVCGSVDPLGPSGSAGSAGWLVTDTTRGHAFQVSPAGDVTWEFRTPFRTGDGDWVAALLDMRRLR